MDMLSDDILRASKQAGETIALVRVTGAEIDNAGTRSESAVLELAVERTLLGEAPPAVSVWRYTSGGNTLLQKGKKYVVAFARGRFGPAERGLGAFVAVPEGKEREIVDAHLAALKRLAAGK